MRFFVSVSAAANEYFVPLSLSGAGAGLGTGAGTGAGAGAGTGAGLGAGTGAGGDTRFEIWPSMDCVMSIIA